VPIVVVLLLAGAYASWVLLRNPILRRLKSTSLQAEDPVADA
jgi:hypothetical protein